MLTINAKAESKNTYVNLESLEFSTNNKDYKSITEYKTLEEFLSDYNSNKLPSIYITDFLYDGVGTVKAPDLDDFIEKDSNDTKIKTLEIKVININTTGNIELKGTIKGAMIGVNTNNVTNDINIILNNVNINTDSKKAPAIYVYNKDKNYTDCKVTIKTVSGTKNYIEGGKLKKVSLIGSDELDKYSSYYTNDNLTNYNKYSSYYGIYTSTEIANILFATVQADSEDLADGDPYYFYIKDEGIETKGNLTFSGGTGDYEIYAEDDCLNTTTANSNEGVVRNDLTINVNSLLAYVDTASDEGDAIDSNGKLIINGGKIYAFAHPSSPDVIATGNMVDQISSDSQQKYFYASFNKIEKDTLIVIKDQNNKIITAFKTDRNIGNLLYSSKDLDNGSYKIYTGGTIEGEETNGLYTKINSYTGGEEIAFNDVSMNIKTSQNKNISKNVLIILITEIVLLVISLTIYIKRNRKEQLV